jgi:Flp pilus assembly protein TadG
VPRSSRKAQPAQALVEFAFVLPVILILLLGMIDFGRAFVFGVAAQEGARQAARLAASANNDVNVDDGAVLGRLVASSAPALTGCAANTNANQSCNGGTWTFNVCVSNNGGPCTTVATARSANTLAGSKVTVTAAGSVSLLAGFQTGAFGLSLPSITVHGQSSMVVL